MGSLVEIRGTYDRIKQDIVRIVGDRNAPVPIHDDATQGTAVENVVLMRDLKKVINDHYKPLKDEKKALWQAVIDEEKKWLEPVEKAQAFLDEMIREYNDRKRAELAVIARREAEQRAADERKRLEAEQEAALAAGNDKVFEEIEEVKKEVIAESVVESKVKTVTDFVSQSEQEEIQDFQILNHQEFADALLSSSNGNCIVLDKKTETAFKKVLLANKTMQKFPGITFKRGFKTSYRTK